MDDLNVMDPPTREVGYRGVALTVKPLTIGQVPKFTRAIRPMFAALAGVVASAPSGDDAGGGGEPLMDVEGLLTIVADHGEAAIEAVAVATNKTPAFICEGSPLEFLELARAVLEVNADFFAKAAAQVVTSGPGPTPSSS
jgi:hypothetical protein